MGSNIPFSASGQRYSFFTPTMVTPIALWLDGSDQTTVTTSGGNLTQWNDKSGNARHVLNSYITGTITYSANTVSTSGTSYFYAPVDSRRTAASNFQVFIVYSWLNSTAGTNQGLWGDDDAGWNRLQLLSFPTATEYAYGLSAGAGSSPTTSSSTTTSNVMGTANKIIYHASYNGTTANGSFVYLNGSNATTFTDTAASPQTTLTNTWFSAIGPNNNNPAQIAFNEIIIYTTTLTTAQRQGVEGYLATKWSLQSSLSNGHPYRTLGLYPPPVLITPVTYPSKTIYSPEFEPHLIAGCDLWLDAQDIFGNGTVPTGGATISTWYDKSGAGNNLTGVNAPTYSTNAVNLSGTAYLSNATPTDSPTTLFFVYNANSGNLGPLFCSQAAADINGFFPNWATTGLMYITQADGAWYSATAILPNQQVNIATVQYSGNGSAINVWYNSSNIISTTQTGTITRSTFVLGARLNNGGNTNYFQGQFYEVIAYNQALGTTKRNQIETYLAKKWTSLVSLSPQNQFAPGSFLSIVNNRTNQIISRRAIQNNKFFPTQLTNCVLWLDATDVNGTGRNPVVGTITSWTDKSGSGNSSTASGGTVTLTANALNNRPGVAFSAASSSYIQVPRVVTNDWSIFILFTTTQTGPNSTPTIGGAHTDAGGNHWWGGQGIFDGEVADLVNDMGISLCGSPTAYLGYGGGDVTANSDTTEFSSTPVNTGAGFFGEFFRTQSTGNLQMYVNGAFQVSTTGGTNAKQSPNLKIGSIQPLPAGYFFTGNVYELICYTRVLTESERQQIEGHIAWKWGLKSSLPGGHPYSIIPPTPS